MKHYRLLPLAFAAMVTLLAPSGVQAAGTITDENASFALNATAFSATPSANFTGVSATLTQDHLFETGWWFRVAGDTQESFFPVPSTEIYSDDTAVIDWTDVGSRGLFSAHLMYTLTDRDGPDGPAPGGKVTGTLTITNIGATELPIDLFNMADFDVNGAGTDSAASVSPTQIRISDLSGNGAKYVAFDADDYLVRAFGATDVGAVLADATITDFDSSGLPFAAGDFTGGWQWKDRVVPVGGSFPFTVILTVNVARRPVANRAGNLVALDPENDDNYGLAGLNSLKKIWYTPDLATWENIPGTLSTLVGGDFNGDGGDDAAGLSAAGKIWYTTDGATWTNVPGTLAKLISGDFDGNGDDGLAGLNANGKIWYTTDMATWSNLPGSLSSLLSADLNGDGFDDLAGLSANGNIWYTTDMATWTNIPGSLAQLISGDFNGDGSADLAGLDTNPGHLFYTTDLTTVNAVVPGTTLAKIINANLDGSEHDAIAGIDSAGHPGFLADVIAGTWTTLPGKLSSLVAGDFDGDFDDDLAGVSAAGKIWYTTDKANWEQIPGTLAP